MVPLTFYILNHPLLPTPYNHRFFVEKFASGFTHHGFDVRVVNRVHQIRDQGFVMISNHDCFDALAEGRLSQLPGKLPALRSGSRLTTPFAKRGQRLVLNRLAGRLRERSGIVAIAWFWHPFKSLFDSLEIPVIFTGECYWREPDGPGARAWRAFNKQHPNALPIQFAAAVGPEQVGDECKNQAIDCSFVGSHSYKPDWQQAFAQDARNRIIGTPPYIDETARLQIFRNSKVVLGLHQDANIANALPIERIYEALAYGAVAVTDSLAAVEATDGIARFAGNLNQAEELVRFFLANERERKEVRERGLQYARDKGTYAHRAAGFIALRDEMISGSRSRQASVR